MTFGTLDLSEVKLLMRLCHVNFYSGRNVDVSFFLSF
jgi:hypothetical protein